MTPVDRTQLELDRLRIKHKRYAEETNRLLTDQAREIAQLRGRLTEYETPEEIAAQ